MQPFRHYRRYRACYRLCISCSLFRTFSFLPGNDEVVVFVSVVVVVVCVSEVRKEKMNVSALSHRRESLVSPESLIRCLRGSGSEIKGDPAGCLSLSPDVAIPRAPREAGRGASGSLIVFKNKLRNPPRPRPLARPDDIRARIH